MDCERFDKMSLDLLYDELDELTTAAARRHLHHCTRCQGVWTKLRVTRELSSPPLEEPPEDLFESILLAEQAAHKQLPFRERFGRTISILAGYAMRPQLAMAALLLLMIGSSLVFLRASPSGRDRIGASERGAPSTEIVAEAKERTALVLGTEGNGDAEPTATGARGTESAAAPGAAAEAALADGAGTAKSDKEGYREAMSAYQQGRYAEAERLFSEVAAAGGEKAAAAALHEAHAARNGSGCQRATALYDQVSGRYAGSTVADEAAWQAASCYQALGQIARARAHYQALAARPAYRTRAEQAMSALDPQVALASKAKAADAAEAAPAARAGAAAGPEEQTAPSAGSATPGEAKPAAPAAAKPSQPTTSP